MNPDLTVLALRLAVVAGLYLFLFQVVRAIARDLLSAGQTARPLVAKGRLVVITSDAETIVAGRTFDLAPVTTIGRDPSSVIELPDSFVSTNHAVLSWRGDGWWIEDLGSTNGTLLNHRPVAAPTAVTYGEAIQIGRVSLKLTRE